MYEAFYQFSEKPFSLLPDPGFLYLSKRHRMALTMLEYGLMNQAGFTVISGDIGAGKTTLIRHLLNNMDQEHTVGLITNTHRSFGELLQWVLLAFNLEHRGLDKVEMHRRFIDFVIDEYANNRRTVLIIDEAQNMEAETLEELRMLSNINADKDQTLQVILVGQRELRETLRRPDLVQFAQRISVDYHLEPLSAEDTAGYIRHRLEVAGGRPDIFTPPACQAVYHFTGGVPRLINLICDTALVYGFAEQLQCITARLVTDVAREKQEGGIFPAIEAGELPVLDEAEAEAAARPAGPAAAPQGDAADTQTAADTQPAAETAAPTGGTGTGPAAADTATPQDEPSGTRPATGASAARPEAAPATRREPQTDRPAAASDTTEAPRAAAPASRSGEAPSKKKLRLAVCAAQENLGNYLARLLESYGLEVVCHVPLVATRLAALDPARFDVLLVDRPETGSPLSAQLAGVLAGWKGPLLYHDSLATETSLRQANPDLGKALSRQVASLAAASRPGDIAVNS